MTPQETERVWTECSEANIAAHDCPWSLFAADRLGHIKIERADPLGIRTPWVLTERAERELGQLADALGIEHD